MKTSTKTILIAIVLVLLTTALIMGHAIFSGRLATNAFIKSHVDSSYRGNFVHLKSERGFRSPMSSTSHLYYHAYEFVPFSGDQPYEITFIYDWTKRAMSEHFNSTFEFPACINGVGPTRCEIEVTYDDAYQQAVKTFATDNQVTVEHKNDGDTMVWKAQQIIGDRNCLGIFRTFNIDMQTGEVTGIEETQNTFCI